MTKEEQASLEEMMDYAKCSEPVAKALCWAAVAHVGQMRKNGVDEYIYHPIGVVKLLIESPWFFTDDELCAAALHDVIEDCFQDLKPAARFGKIADEFGYDVAGMVYLLSKPEEKYLRRKIYMASLGRVSPVVLAIKLADFYHNLTTADSISDPHFAAYFAKKVSEDTPPIIEVMRMHGTCWWQYASWIRDRINKELRKYPEITTEGSRS